MENYMIKECNFKYTTVCGEVDCGISTSGGYSGITHQKCVEEDNCVIYQTYKLLQEKQNNG